MFCKNCRFLLTSAFLPPNVFIYRNADLLYIVCFKIMFNKCLYINAYVQSLFQKEIKVASKMFEVTLRTDNAYRL